MKRLIGVAAAAMLAACGGGPAPPIDAAKVLRDGAAALGKLQTVSATLKLTKGTVTLQGFTLVSARTAVCLPADSDTTYTVKEKDITIGLEVVIASGRVYLRLPLLNFQQLSPAQASTFPDMAKLFDTRTGLPAMIPAGMKPRYVSTDQLGNQSAYQVSTTYTADQVRALLAQLSSSGPVTAHVWVDTTDHLIRKAVLEGAFGDGGTNAAVEVDLTGFDRTVIISSPAP